MGVRKGSSVLVACAIVAASFPARAGAPAHEPEPGRFYSALDATFKAGGWTVAATVDENPDTNRVRTCLVATRRITRGSVRIVTEMRGCAKRAQGYSADVTAWEADLTSGVLLRGDRFRQERMDGHWHGTGVLGFVRERAALRLSFVGEGLITPSAGPSLCPLFVLPVAVCSARVSASRQATVTGSFDVFDAAARIRSVSAAQMQFWTQA